VEPSNGALSRYRNDRSRERDRIEAEEKWIVRELNAPRDEPSCKACVSMRYKCSRAYLGPSLSLGWSEPLLFPRHRGTRSILVLALIMNVKDAGKSATCSWYVAS